MENTVQSFLMIGQSNMAGRGFAHEVKPIFDEHIKVLVNGRWQTMHEPINPDRPTSGIGLAASFAGAWRLDHPDQQIGLIPCAEGGSSLDEWAVDGILFENAVFHAKLAQRNSSLIGILWHQGENDSFGGRSATYSDKLSVIVNALRKELDSPDIPFIVGGLGDYLQSGRYGSYFTEYNTVNNQLLSYCNSAANAYFVTSTALTANPDGLHLDARSLRRFGIRYYEAFKLQSNVLTVPKNENELIEQIQNRKLSVSEETALLEIAFSSGKLSLEELQFRLAKLDETR